MICPHELYFAQMQRLEQDRFGSVTLTQEDVGPSLQQILRDELRVTAAAAAGVVTVPSMDQEPRSGDEEASTSDLTADNT